jgi:hypothetical protein
LVRAGEVSIGPLEVGTAQVPVNGNRPGSNAVEAFARKRMSGAKGERAAGEGYGRAGSDTERPAARESVRESECASLHVEVAGVFDGDPAFEVGGGGA